MLTSYAGIVKDGQIYLRDSIDLPEGAQVIVVVSDRSLSVDEQERCLAGLSSEEWSNLFDEFAQFSVEQPAEINIETVSDDDLVAIVHEVRQARQ
ncbi:MAG: hypothetical protein HC875_16050 [Anaerolineales bacterium]|nr:hypothetical protein [Anaerolineales bacterium]